MHIFIQALRFHFQLLKKFPIATGLIILTYIYILVASWHIHTFFHAVCYIAAMLFSIYAIEIVCTYKGNKIIATPLPVSKPVIESWIIVLNILLASVFLYFRFIANWDHIHGILRLSLIPLLLFTFPVALAAVFLFYYRYRLGDMGIRFKPWYVAIPVFAIVGLFSWIGSPENIHWNYISEIGIFSFIIEGFFTAALSEEFLRMLIITRWGAALKNKGIAFFLSGLIWALMHFPTFFNQNHQVADAFLGCIYILPLGLLWGYMTWRTRSIIPSVLLHGLNMWGIQNF